MTEAAVALKPYTMTDIAEIGRGVSKSVSEITTKFTQLARTGDLEEVGAALDDLLVEAKKYAPDDFARKGAKLFGIIPIPSFVKANLQKARQKFQTVDASVNQLAGEVDKRVALFKARVPELTKLFEINQEYHQALGQQIDNASERIQWMKDNPPALIEGDPKSAEERDTWSQVVAYAEKRVDDLRRVQVLAEQTGPQIRMMALNSSTLAEKFSAVKDTVIPALKNQFSLYVINVEQKRGVELATKIDDMFDQAIKQNASMLRENVVATNRALTRSAVSIETLKFAQDQLITSIAEVKQIRAEMSQRIAAERPQLELLAQDMTKRLAAS